MRSSNPPCSASSRRWNNKRFQSAGSKAAEAAAYQKNLEQNERTAERNSAERAEKLGDNQQAQPQKPEQDQQAAKEAYNREMAAKLAASSFSRDLELDRSR